MMITLKTKNLILQTSCLNDLMAIYDFEIKNKEHLKKWESISYETGEALKEEVKKRLELWITEDENKKSLRWLIRPKDHSNQLIGFCNFTQIFYGPFQACYLGYKI